MNVATVMQTMAVGKVEDPDAQHTINDFQDYTEYLPSDLTRSLGLIGKLDDTYLDRAAKVHDLTAQYGAVPQLPAGQKPDLEVLRRDISYNLDSALSAREAAYGEASRLHEMVERHYRRLVSINAKLKALPKPPSRDPTPVPRSPVASRKSPPRITLRLDGPKPSGRIAPAPPKPRDRKKRITIPGEVLPPPNPDSPTSFTASDWESIPPSPLPMPTSRVGGSRKKGKPMRLKAPKPPKALKERGPRIPRLPGMGTNVHSQVAGISTSNALSLLPAPPPDAKPGSEHAPWMRLTEYEMAKLRKRMKKNAIWTPSETMIRRELADAGRGPDNYRSHKAKAEAEGEEFLDVDNIATSAPGKPLMPGEISADALGLTETNLSNRGMKLNEAKKLKREAMLAASAEELKATSTRVAALDFNQIFSNPPVSPHPVSTPVMSHKEKSSKKDKREKYREDGKSSSQKRKREDEIAKSGLPATHVNIITPSEKQPKKKQKTAQALSPDLSTTVTKTTTTTIPLAASAPSPPKSALPSDSIEPATPTMAAPEKPKTSAAHKPSPSTATSSRPRRISLTLRGPSEPSAAGPNSPRNGSRTTSVRGSIPPNSAGPTSATFPRDHLRRKSATPATPTSPVKPITAASRRSKRPAPGALVKDQDGGATVSVGKRLHAPKKSASNVKGAHVDSDGKNVLAAPGEEIDPNEPRYCLCGDVSYGEMVGCDNDDVSLWPFYYFIKHRR